MSMTTELAAVLRLAAESEIAYRAEGETSDLWQEEASPENVLALVEALEAAEKRIAELEASHSTLRETLAAIHNTIKLDGFTTPLAVIMRNAQCAYEESAAAAGVAVEGE